MPYSSYGSAPDRKHHGVLVSFFLFLILVIAIVVTLNILNNGRVTVIRQSVTIASLPSDLESFRILHISDLDGLEYGKDQATLQISLQGFKYNAVCITGDVCSSSGSYYAFLKLIDLFAGKVPVFFIPGDEDPSPVLTSAHASDSPLASFITAAQEHGAIYLDAPQKITVGSSSIWFCPESIYDLDIASARQQYQASLASLSQGEMTPDRKAAIAAVEYRLDLLDRTEQAMSSMRSNDVQIVLTHYPISSATALTFQQWSGTNGITLYRNVSLILAGHTCGGQYRLPGIGAIRSTDGTWFPSDSAVSGISTVFGVTQYTSPGLGYCSYYPIKLRFFNTPAVTVLTLTSKLV